MRQNGHGFICLQPPPFISATSPATLLSFHTISSDTLRLFLKLRLLTWCRRPNTTCLCGRTLPRTILCGAGESHSTPLNCALQQRRSRTGHVSLHFFPLPFLFSFVLFLVVVGWSSHLSYLSHLSHLSHLSFLSHPKSPMN